MIASPQPACASLLRSRAALARRRSRSPANSTTPLTIRNIAAATGEPNRWRSHFSKTKPSTTAGNVPSTKSPIRWRFSSIVLLVAPPRPSAASRGRASRARNRPIAPSRCRRAAPPETAETAANPGRYASRSTAGRIDRMAEAADRKQLGGTLDDGKENRLKDSHIDRHSPQLRAGAAISPERSVRRHNLLAGAELVKSRRTGRCFSRSGLAPTAQWSGWAINSNPSAAARSRSACHHSALPRRQQREHMILAIAPDRPARPVERHQRRKRGEIGKSGRAHPPVEAAIGDPGGADRIGRGLDLAANRLGQIEVPPLLHVERPHCDPGPAAGPQHPHDLAQRAVGIAFLEHR